jgi:hypothetical protein
MQICYIEVGIIIINYRNFEDEYHNHRDGEVFIVIEGFSEGLTSHEGEYGEEVLEICKYEYGLIDTI